MFVCFGSYLFALLAKWLSTSTQEDDRPEPVVAVCARSEHCSSRGVLSKFFPAGVNKTIYDFPGFSMRPILYVRTTGKMLSVFVALSHEHSPGHIPQVDNRTCREHDVTTLLLISIRRQHHACVTRPSALYCCGYSNCCVHRSLRSVRAVLVGYFYFTICEMYFMVFMKKNVVIIIEHTLPCNVPSIRTTTIHSKGYALTEIKLL